MSMTFLVSLWLMILKVLLFCRVYRATLIFRSFESTTPITKDKYFGMRSTFC